MKKWLKYPNININQISHRLQIISISIKYLTDYKLSQYQPNISQTTTYLNINQIAHRLQIISISTKYLTDYKLSQYQPNSSQTTNYLNIIINQMSHRLQISIIKNTNISKSVKLQNAIILFQLAQEFVSCT